MSRIPIASLAGGTIFDLQPVIQGSPLLIPAVGIGCQVFVHDTSSPGTVYADEFSGTVLSPITGVVQTLVTDSVGNTPGWVEAADLPLDLSVSLASGPKVFVLGPPPSSGLSESVADLRYIHQDLGAAAEDLIKFNGSAFVRVPKGATDTIIVARSDGTVAYEKLQEHNLASWGVQADGQSGTCCTPIPGTNQFTFVSRSGVTDITSLDAGKKILVYGAGPANSSSAVSNADGGAFLATIQSVSGTTVTLDLNFPQNIPSSPVYGAHWGTDNTAALANAISTLSRGRLKLPQGDILYFGPIDLNVAGSAQPNGNNNSMLHISGAGQGFGSWGGAGNWQGPKGVTRLINLSKDEAIVLGSSKYSLSLRDFTVKQTRVGVVPDQAAIGLYSWIGGGSIQDVSVESASPYADGWKGTFVTGASTITAIGASDGSTTTTIQHSGNTTIRVGDYVYGANVAAGTQVSSVDPSTSTIGVSIPLTGGGAGTSGVTFYTIPACLGSAIQVDNQSDGGLSIVRPRSLGFMSPPQTINLKGGATYLFRGSAALKFGAQIYNQGGSQGGPTTTNIAGTSTNGSNVVSSIDNFNGWWPGALIEVLGGGGDTSLNGAQVLKVDRVNQRAYLSKTATGSTGAISMRIYGSGGESGNLTIDTPQAQACTIGVYGYGLQTTNTMAGAECNSCTILTPKYVGSGHGGFPSGSQFPVSYGMLFEHAHEEVTIISPHNEQSWHGMALEGTSNFMVIAPMCSAGGGYAGIGVGSGRSALNLSGADNEIRRLKVTSAGWDHAVTVLTSTARADVTYSVDPSFSVLGQEVVRAGSRVAVTKLNLRGFRSNVIKPLFWVWSNAFAASMTALTWRFTRFVIEETGLFCDLVGWLQAADNATPTHFWAAIYDCGEASAGNYTRLWDSGSVTSGATAGVFQSLGNPQLPVYEGQHLMLGWTFDGGTGRIGTYFSLGASTAGGQLPTNYLPNTGGLLPKVAGTFTAGSFAVPPATLSEASMGQYNTGYSFLGRTG